MATHPRRQSLFGDNFSQGEAVLHLARQRIRAFDWNSLPQINFNLQGLVNYCSNQPIGTVVVVIVAMLAVLPVMLGIALFVVSVMTFTFMTLGIVMVTMMIFMTIVFVTFTLFGIGYYLRYLKSSKRPTIHSR